MDFINSRICSIVSVVLASLSTSVLGDDINNIRTNLEQAMARARTAIESRDLSQFQSSVDPSYPRSKITKEEWEHLLIHPIGSKVILRAFPNLTEHTQFLKTTTKHNWAVYYAVVDSHDGNYQSVRAYVFHKNTDEWRPTGKSHSFTKAKAGSNAANEGLPAWKGKKDWFNVIETDPDFHIDDLTSP